jgi:hypothetical protein
MDVKAGGLVLARCVADSTHTPAPHPVVASPLCHAGYHPALSCGWLRAEQAGQPCGAMFTRHSVPK